MPAEPEPWEWQESTWRTHVDRVRAGRSLAPSRWPGDARVAVALSFDSDHETISLRANETSPGKLLRTSRLRTAQADRSEVLCGRRPRGGHARLDPRTQRAPGPTHGTRPG